MGREVASAYRRRKSVLASLSPSPPRSAPATIDRMPENLTPARKHHKLLKDGSEVWSKEVEKIFVDGLRDYWGSPWATYSRGRSRWRNQFLVDHLHKHGIERTKKQVASHIQVLRNMWRGQPEFHLVAGGEELFQENGLLSQTKSTQGGSPDSASTSQLELPESSAGSSSSSSTPEYTTSEFPPELPTPASYPSLSPPCQASPFPDLPVEEVFAAGIPDSGFPDLSSPPRTTHPMTPMSIKLEPLAMDPALFTLPTPSFSETPADYTISLPNRISSLYFWADGMVPLSINVDRLVGANPSSPSRTFLHLRVTMPPVADLRCPPNLQGVNGAVSFATPWTSIAKCQTKSWGTGRTVVSQDLGLFTQATTPELQLGLVTDPSSPQTAYAYLPDSALTRCHWLDSVRTITQQVVVDNEVLAVLVYHIERAADATRTAPAMELIGFQKYPWRGASASAPTSSTASSFPLIPSPSPPVSPHSPTFAQAFASASQSPLFTRTSVPSGTGSGVDDMSAAARLMYTYPPPPLPFGFSAPQ
ncbi:hypothetical protein C8Q76DRAFT_799139 [Earliella scabrosa]|nr:hypothetical protein C8Q76DRAFT_799139 [Earliella scabrosa]